MIINTMKTIRETIGKMDVRYEMYQNNIEDILNSTSDQCRMIINGFVFGYAQGMKAAKAEMKKQTRVAKV